MKLIKDKEKAITVDILPYHINLTIRLERDQIYQVQNLMESLQDINTDKDYEITIKPYRKGRSLNANKYYYALVNKCAEKQSITPTEYHNRNLAELGIPWRGSDNKVHWLLQVDDDFWLKQKESHFCPTDRTEERNGVVYRWFYLLKPSHLFDTKEMSRLIDGIVEDAKVLGIETLPPDTIEELKQKWGCG